MKTLTTKKEDAGTVARKSFEQLRRRYPDSILIFRMGDEYQAFYEDAQVCSEALGLALDYLEKDDGRIPLVSIHLWAFNENLGKLLLAGHKIAVVESRYVRTITPGTDDDDPAAIA